MAGNGPFVVRPQAPLRRAALLRGAAVAAGLLALCGAFEAGRYSLGHGDVHRVDTLQSQLQSLQSENHDLRTQAAAFETERAGRAHEREEVASQIAELQAQVDRDRQDLAVYRGVVSPAAPAGLVQVQRLRVTAGEGPQQFRVHLTLMQAGKPDAVVGGTARVIVRGEGPGAGSTVPALGLVVSLAPASSPPAQPAAVPPAEAVVKFSFRYYQALEYTVQLPSGLRPQRIEVELRAGRPGASAVTQSFPWKVEPT